MPFCTQCGTEVALAAQFCPRCGARQAAPPSPFGGMAPGTASALCYIPFVGWIVSLVFLASEPYRHDRAVRFHAFQGLYLFVFYLLVDIAVAPVFGFSGHLVRRMIGSILHAALLFGSLYMLIQTLRGQFVRLPVIGELAEKSMA